MIALGLQTLDITLPKTIEVRMREVRPDLVINAATCTAFDKAETEPDAAHPVNAAGAGNVAYAAREAGAAIIHISTGLRICWQ